MTRTGLARLDELVLRLAREHVVDDRVDHAGLGAALAALPPGDGGVVHATGPDGGAVLTGLSYQTTTLQVLNAVLTGLAVEVLERGAPHDDDRSHPLAGLLESRVAEIEPGSFARRATPLVRDLLADPVVHGAPA